MKRTMFILLLLQVCLISSCSKDDDVSSLNEIDHVLVGSWNTSEDLTGNTYILNPDGTAVYTSSWSDNGIAETFIYNGAWDVIEENILIQYYPDESVEWNDNWKETPTLKQYFEFLNGCTLQLTNYHDAAHVNMHYRESDLTSHKKATQPYMIEISTGELLGSWVSVVAETKTYFNNCTYEEKYSNFDYENKIVEVEIPKGAISFELQFSLEDVDENTTVHIKFYGKDNGEIVHEETIVGQRSYTYEYNFQ